MSNDNSNQQFYRPSSILSIRLNSDDGLLFSFCPIAPVSVLRRPSGLRVAAADLRCWRGAEQTQMLSLVKSGIPDHIL